MTRIAYILLCHKNPEAVIAQAGRLTAGGDCVAIHYDARAPRADVQAVAQALADTPGVIMTRRRVRCGWGEWSLVQATLNTLAAAEAAFPQATHFYMLSGDCMPIKSRAYIHAWLERDDADYIESVDFLTSGWIKTGLREERLIYRHFFNERARKRLFYASLALQKRLRLERSIPDDIQVMIGSQWWCLRRTTVERVLEFTRARRDVVRFFRTTWIPDETFFQTLVNHLVPATEIRRRTLTLLMFSDYGMPVTFYNDHHDLLLSQDYLFARKISPEALELKRRLGALYNDDQAVFTVSDEARRLYSYFTRRGREGRRFARRFWESEASLGRDSELLMVACKKWHVAKRLVRRAMRLAGIPAVDYLFNEIDTPLPDLGGIERTLEKRTRHRRALLRMLLDSYQSDRLIICLDPAATDLIRDFDSDRCTSRILEVECRFTDAYLEGHARRLGLAGEKTSRDVMARLLPTLRGDIRAESERLRDHGYSGFSRLREGGDPEENAAALAGFLNCPPETARAILDDPNLFSD